MLSARNLQSIEASDARSFLPEALPGRFVLPLNLLGPPRQDP
jgi:hypothetical protein